MRSKFKLNFHDNAVYRLAIQVKKKVFSDGFAAFVRSRRSIILSVFLNKSFFVYNGHKSILLKVSKSMINYKFGEYSFSKKRSKSIHFWNKKSRKKKK